jgi:lysophospholipase
MRFEGNPLTTDMQRFQDWRDLIEAHRDRSIGGVTYGWLDAALRSIALTRRPNFLSRIDVPCLIITAGGERIVDNAAAHEAVGYLRRGQLIEVASALHDLFLAADPERTTLMSALKAFLDRFSRAAARQSPAKAPVDEGALLLSP